MASLARGWREPATRSPTYAILNSVQAAAVSAAADPELPMDDIVQIPVPLPHIKSVNAWLLHGEPLTLVDTGPYGDEAFASLQEGLKSAGVRVEDIELVLVTHHH